VLIGERQQSQKTRAFDGCIELALVNGTGTRQTSGNDFAVLGYEIPEGIDVLVVNFFNACDSEAAKALALKKKRLGIALGALIFGGFFESSHELFQYSA